MPKPAFCPYIYKDGRSIFLEFDQMTLQFDRSDGGLHKALRHIPNIEEQPGFLSGGRNILPPRKMAKGHIARKTQVTAPAKVAKATEAQRIQDRLSGKLKATAADIIRKAKL